MDATVEAGEQASRRRYSDVEKSEALLVLETCEGNYWRAAQVTGIPHPTLYDWRNGRGIPADVKERAQAATERLAGGFQDLAERIVDGITDEVIQAAGLQQRVMSAAIATDKMRLLREQATSISAQQMTDEERLARLNELLATALSLPETEQPAALEAHAEEQEQTAAHVEGAPAHSDDAACS